MTYDGMYCFYAITPLGLNQPSTYERYYKIDNYDEDQMRQARVNFALKFGVDLELVHVRKVE